MRLLPQEPSAAGFMIVSFLCALVLSPLPPERLAAASLLLLLHLSTFDETFRRLKASLKRALPLLVLNVTPYIALSLFIKVNVWTLALPTVLLACYLCLSKVRNSPYAYILGSTIPTLTAFTVFYLAPHITYKEIAFWYGLAVYVSATTAYIESKLPWRDVKSYAGALVWLLAVPLILLKPLIVITFVEPSLKFLWNSIKDGKINPKEIKKLGWIEMIRFLLYSTLLLIIFKFF